MKKYLLLAGVASIMSFNANAMEMEMKPYVGLDYVYSMMDTDKLDGANVVDENLNAYAISAGMKMHKNFGVEAFFQQTEEGKKHYKGAEVKDKYHAYGVDMIGYMPLGCDEKVELLGSLGLGYYDTEVKALGEKETDDAWGWRLGAGAQYNFTENMAGRVMVRYADVDIEGIDNIVDLTAGVRYSF